MRYVFDSSAFIDLFDNYFLNRFPSLWGKFDQSVSEKSIISVREVYNEINDYGDRLSLWAKNNKGVFQTPSPDELIFVFEILAIPHFQSLISKTARLQGKPVADPFVIAKARALNACVVTNESKKPTAARIPNVCEHFKIDCTNLEGFMERENWTF